MNAMNIKSECIQANGCVVSTSTCDLSCKICNGTKNVNNKVTMQAVNHNNDLFISILIKDVNKDNVELISKEEIVKELRLIIDNFMAKHKK